MLRLSSTDGSDFHTGHTRLKANGFVLHWIESSKSTIAIRRVTNLKQSKPCHKWEGFYTSENTVHTYTSCIYHVCLMYPLNFTLHHPWYTIIHVFTTTRGNTLDIQTPPNNWNIPRKLRRENLIAKHRCQVAFACFWMYRRKTYLYHLNIFDANFQSRNMALVSCHHSSGFWHLKHF